MTNESEESLVNECKFLLIFKGEEDILSYWGIKDDFEGLRLLKVLSNLYESIYCLIAPNIYHLI
jgi:hypothetical protein